MGILTPNSTQINFPSGIQLVLKIYIYLLKKTPYYGQTY